MSDPIRLEVTNGPVYVGVIRVIGVVSSSSVMIGDTDKMTLYSYFDTPPESIIVGPMAPLPQLPREDIV